MGDCPPTSQRPSVQRQAVERVSSLLPFPLMFLGTLSDTNRCPHVSLLHCTVQKVLLLGSCA